MGRTVARIIGIAPFGAGLYFAIRDLREFGFTLDSILRSFLAFWIVGLFGTFVLGLFLFELGAVDYEWAERFIFEPTIRPIRGLLGFDTDPEWRAIGESELGYEDYLESDEWRERRDFMKRRFPACQRCGSRERLEVHHKTYQRLGHERITDLEVLCRFCHEAEHGIRSTGSG